jgi:hypothetical protein
MQVMHALLFTLALAADWESLFDGKSLKGWDASPGSDAFTVADGAIRATPRPKFREDLATKKHYSDFELEFEWKISAGGNSGLKYRVQDIAVVHPAFVPDTIRKFEHRADYALRNPNPRAKMPQDGKGEIYYVAFEYQVIDNTAHPDAKRSQKSWAGALYQLIAPSENPVRAVGEWNQARVLVKGDHVEHWLNGKKVVDATLADPAIAAGLASRWTTESPVYKLLTGRPRKAGPIVLQNHNDEAWFRNLRIRPIR